MLWRHFLHLMRAKFIIILIICGIIFIGIAILLFRQSVSPPLRIYHIAIVTRKGVASYEEAITNYRKKMNEIGYIEGKNIFYDIRYYDKNAELKEIIRDIVASDPHVISTY